MENYICQRSKKHFNKKGAVPAKFTAEKVDSIITDIQIIAEFTGSSFVDPFGTIKLAQKPQRFQFTKFFQPIDFTVSWYSFDSSTNPIKDSLYLDRLKTQRPFKIENVNRLDYAWWGGIKAGDQQHGQFFTVAEGSAYFQKGEYEMGITWDDAVRVYVDGKLIINEWNPSLYKFDESPNKKIHLSLNGLHHIRVEHVELGGFATLSLKFRKMK